MKPFTLTRAVILLTAWVSCQASALADEPDLSKWTHVAGVNLSTKPAKGIVELPLPPEVFAAARADLGDLRLVSQAGEPVPYVLRVDRCQQRQSMSSYPVKTFNPVFVPGKQSSVTVDFGSGVMRTRIDIKTPGTNFRRQVMVEASQDAVTWQVLCRTAWLFQISYPNGSYSKDDVSLPENDFRYLRITVFNAPDDPEQIVIQEVLAWNVASTPPGTASVEVRSVKISQNDKLKATEIEVDLGYENLPLYDVEFSFEDANFFRGLEILGRNPKHIDPLEDEVSRTRRMEEPWNDITSGVIYRFPGPAGQDPSIGLSLVTDKQCRYLLVRIYNGDNAPLKFAGLKVRRLQYYLEFVPQSAGPCQLYLGNPHAQQPQYDLEHFATRLRAEGVTPATLAPVLPNPSFAIKVPWSEQYKWLLWGTLLTVLAVLAIMVLRQSKSVKPIE